MGKQPPKNKLENIEDSLDRIASSLASISGIFHNFYTEIMKEKKEEERQQKEMLAKQSPFEHERS